MRMFLAILLCSMAASPQSQQGGLNAHFDLLTTSPAVHEPVLLQFTVENLMAESVTVDFGFNDHGYGGFKGRMIFPDGHEESAPIPRLEELVQVSHGPVRAGHIDSEKLLLNRWFNFDKPGRYTLDIETTRPVLTASGLRYSYPIMGHIVIEVVPRDPERLTVLYRGLLDRALEGDALNPDFETLVSMRDPVAIPFLERLIAAQEKHPPVGAIQALLEIEDASANEVLIRLLKSSDPDAVHMARYALSEKAKRTTDPELRAKIKAALQ